MNAPNFDLTQSHLDRIRAFYDAAPVRLNWLARSYRELLAHHYNLLIPKEASVLEIGCGAGYLLSRLQARRKVGLDLSVNQIAQARERLPEAEFHVQAGEHIQLKEKFDYLIISDTLNLAADVHLLLERLHPLCHENTRLVFNFYSSLWRPVIFAAHRLGLKSSEPQSSWLASTDIANLLVGRLGDAPKPDASIVARQVSGVRTLRQSVAGSLARLSLVLPYSILCGSTPSAAHDEKVICLRHHPRPQ